MQTTAIYPNRIADKAKLEKKLGLPEDGTGFKIYIMTPGNQLISTGYVRIVYGDHGPYIEMDRSTVEWQHFTCERKGIGYYDKWYSKDRVMLYDQRRTVSLLKNPPRDGKSVAYSGNRPEGYADYKIGMIYVDPYACTYRKDYSIEEYSQCVQPDFSAEQE